MNCDGQIGMITIVLEESQIDIFITYCQEDHLKEDMATHSSILAWRNPWIEEPQGWQSMGLQRVRHDWSDLARTYFAIKETICTYPENWSDNYMVVIS